MCSWSAHSNGRGRASPGAPVRPPDFIIGGTDNPYILRWWVIPRNRFFNVYLHKIMRSDDERALHDHPWWNLSIVLRGGYEEIMPRATKWRGPGSVVLRRATAAHRLVIPIRNGGIRFCWSLFITGPKIRDWGFHCPQGWRHWKIFVAESDTGNIGKGCA